MTTSAIPEAQTTATVLMVRPGVFYANPETARSNAFQQPGGQADPALLRAALHEFDSAVARLADAGVEVLEAAAPQGDLPDALFPNNWFSTHADGTLALYPMESLKRRAERQPGPVQALLHHHGFTIRRVLDLTSLEASGQMVEGTGSLVLDRVARVAWACRSGRTHPAGVATACEALGYLPRVFSATDAAGRPIYHTNVMLSIGSGLAMVCAEAVQDPGERGMLLDALTDSGRRLVELSQSQVAGFAGNALELRGHDGPLLALSSRAWACLTLTQRRAIESAAEPLPVDVTTIERVGGGGIRCMLAEIHLPRVSAPPG